MRKLGEHAVVLGASMAGLLAARALAEAYERVTIVERDELPAGSQGRKGVPQGRHAHLLLSRGQRILEDLFPGLSDELEAAGAVVTDPTDTRFRLSVGGHLLSRIPAGGRTILASRPLLEGHVRERMRARAGVAFAEGYDVVGLAVTGPGRVTGARIVRRAVGSAEEELAADLVVVATGRGDRTSAWLEALGYQPAPEEEVQIDMAYASRYLRLPEGSLSDKMVLIGSRPDKPRAMAMLFVEYDRYLLTLAGFGVGHRPPTDPEGFLAFAATVAPPDVFAAIQEAELLGDIVPHRYPSDLRRHYERLRRFPAGLLVTGDALCSFNPVYAQGMTVAALEAVALRRCLAAGDHDLARRFFRAAAKAADTPWQIAVSGDLTLPEVKGQPDRATRLLNAYMDRVLTAAEHDATVTEQFFRVIGLLDPPSRLMRPAILARTMRRGRRRTAPEVAPATS